MDNSQLLGKKLRFFRKRIGLSQFSVELELNMSQGSLSRIESGIVNPTSNTVIHLSEYYNLNDIELDFLIGETSIPATDNDIKKVNKILKTYFKNDNTLSYLLDERQRILNVSDLFLKLLEISKLDFEKHLYKTPLIWALNSSFVNAQKIMSKKSYKIAMTNLVKRYRSEVGFMQFDKVYQETINAIMANPFLKSIWEESVNMPLMYYQPIETRYVEFNYKGFKVNLHYSNESVLQYPRFQVIEYSPTDLITKSLFKIMKS